MCNLSIVVLYVFHDTNILEFIFTVCHWANMRDLPKNKYQIFKIERITYLLILLHTNYKMDTFYKPSLISFVINNAAGRSELANKTTKLSSKTLYNNGTFYCYITCRFRLASYRWKNMSYAARNGHKINYIYFPPNAKKSHSGFLMFSGLWQSAAILWDSSRRKTPLMFFLVVTEWKRIQDGGRRGA